MRFPRFTKRSSKPALQYPIQPVPRVAVFDDRYATRGSAVVMPPDKINHLEKQRMETVAATADLLSLIGALGFKPSHPMVVFTTPEQRLTDDARERFWREFEVPVFEQIVDRSGNLLASECEAHWGLHLETTGHFELPGTELTRDLCGCGRSGARLVPTSD